MLFANYLHSFVQTLTMLDLSVNKITDQGVQHLSHAVRNNTVTIISSSFISYIIDLHLLLQTLITLNLRRNTIGVVGTQYLADVVRNNTVVSILLHLSNILFIYASFFS